MAATTADTGDKESKYSVVAEHITFQAKDVDVAASLDSDKPLHPEVAARLRCSF